MSVRAEAKSEGPSSYLSSKESLPSIEQEKAGRKANKTDETLHTKFNTFLEQD